MKRIIGAVLMVWLLFSCSSLSVVTDYWEDADFSSFKTFQYKESKMTLANTAPLAHRRIVSAIREEMVAAGLKEVDAEPDLYVTYYGKENENVVIMTTGWEYHDPWYWDRGRTTRGSRHRTRSTYQSTTQEVTIREGTLLIDIWEAREKELVWRAEISNTLSDNPNRNSEMIMKGISRAFSDFPPGSGS